VHSFLKFSKYPLFGLLPISEGESFVIVLIKLIGLHFWRFLAILGDFFTSASGHPGATSTGLQNYALNRVQSSTEKVGQ
jgi:hypothetical protein